MDISKPFSTFAKKFATCMKNPFTYGTTVDESQFLGRKAELERVKQLLNNKEHLALIGPCRFGKTSLVQLALKQTRRPYLVLNWQHVINANDFVMQLLREVKKVRKHEPLQLSSNDPLTEVMELLESTGQTKPGFTVVFDGFQEVKEQDIYLIKRLAQLIREQEHVTYIFLGNQESGMTDLFEKRKSPFWNIGEVLRLDKIPYDTLNNFVSSKMMAMAGVQNSKSITRNILEITNYHPYYTQQLAAQVWQILVNQGFTTNVVETAVNEIISMQDLNYERIWVSMNRTDRRVLQTLCRHQKIFDDKSYPTSTTFSAVKRLMQAGYIVKNADYELEDPFFERWIMRFLS